MAAKRLKFDEIGYWSELKLEIIRKYATAYSTILAAQRGPSLHHSYVDGFAGAGQHLSKTSGEVIPGSPVIALQIDPPFREYHFIDLDETKTGHLRALIGDRSDVHVYEGDCNEVLMDEVFPEIKYEQYRRGLCLLDPYGLHLKWKVIATAAKLRSLELFLNFPVADINRNVLWRNPEGVSVEDIQRMNDYWGDDSWKKIAYPGTKGLFGMMEEKTDNATIAEAFRQRLLTVAKFKYVPAPLPMRNKSNAIIYYLFFASHKPVAGHIVEDVFAAYRPRMS